MHFLVIILWINCVSSNPTMSPAPVAEVENNGNITLTCSPFMRETLWTGLNVPSSIHIQQDCSYTFYPGNITSDMEITCKVSYSALTLSRVSGNRHGQIWHCQGPYYARSYPTVVVVKELAAADTCSQDTEIKVCPYPVAYIGENQSLKITARYTGSHVVQSISWNEYMRIFQVSSHLVYPNCSYGYGDIPDGYEFVCNRSMAEFTMIKKNVRNEMHGQMLKIEFEVLPLATISKYIILYFEAIERSSTLTTNSSMSVTISNGTTPLIASTRTGTYTSEHSLTISNGTKHQSPPTTRRTTTSESSPCEQCYYKYATSATTISSPSPTRIPSYVPNPAEYDIQMVLMVKVDMEFNENYQNKLSSEYQSLARNFSASLTDIYKNVMGFKSIDVLRFRPSVVAEYFVKFYANIDLRRVTEEIKTNVAYSIKSISGVPVDTDYTIRTMTEMLDIILNRDRCSLASENVCPFGYYCKPSAGTVVLCLDRCNSTICQNNGECYIDHHNSNVQCRCPVSTDLAYSGSRCEARHEVLQPQEKVIYIVIGCSVIFGIIMISVVIMITLKRHLIRQKKTFPKEKKHDDMVMRTKNDTHDVNNKYMTDASDERQRGSDIHLYHREDRSTDPSYSYLKHQTEREDSAYDYIDPHNKVLSEPRFDFK